MKNLLRSIGMAFSMFSIIPMPRLDWKPENMRWMLAVLPLVGVVCGLALCGWYWLCRALGFGALLFAAGMTILPLLISGGIHMDGFGDTVDALASHADPERKREILKDAHVGSFAVVFTVVYLIAYFAFASELYVGWTAVILLAIQQVLARAVGAFAGVAFPKSASHGTLFAFADSASKRSAGVLIGWMAVSAIVLIWLSVPAGIVTVVIALLCLLGLHRMSERQFGGMSGDLSGYIIMLSSLLMLVGTVVVEKVAML